MKRITSTIAALFITAVLCKAQAQTEADMKTWMDYMTPGEIHKMIASWDGTWTGEVSLWMAPGAPRMAMHTSPASAPTNGSFCLTRCSSG